jgi:hypothetical protein
MRYVSYATSANSSSGCPISSATRLAWPRRTLASDTVPRASSNPAPGVAAPCCRTPVNNTHKDELLTLHYPWHRLHGRQLSVVRLFSKHGGQICHCVEPGRVGLPSVELPLWMFDRVQCAWMRSSSFPSANLRALVALQQLLNECKGSPVVTTRTSVQTEAQPQTGDTNVDQTKPAVQTAGSLHNDPGPTSVGPNSHHRPKGTSPVAPGDVIQSTSAATARSASEGRPA